MGRAAPFPLLETIREYAAERLEELDEGREIRRRHAEYLVSWLEPRDDERLEGTLIGQYQQEDAEQENTRAALAWARDAGEAELSLRLAAALRFYWFARFNLSEGQRWLDTALEQGYSAAARPPSEGLLASATMAWPQGETGAGARSRRGGKRDLRLRGRPPPPRGEPHPRAERGRVGGKAR